MNKLKQIYVVFKTHFDFGFTGLPEEVLNEYKTAHLPKAVKTCRESLKYGKDHAYKWTLPSWLLLKCLDDLKGTPIFDELDEMVRTGLITWHYIPMTTHTEFMGVEDYIRGFSSAEELSRRYGHDARSAKMTDVPGHTWILPSLLYKAGVRFLHIGCNECATPPDVPELFFWEGPDGNRILTMYSKGNYGTGLRPPAGWKYSTWLDIEHTEDNIGAHDIQFLEKLLKQAEEDIPSVDIRTGTLDDFAEAVLSEDPDLPVIKGDLADSWIHGVGAYPEEVSSVRYSRNRIGVLESIESLRSILGKDTYENESSDTKQLIKNIYDYLLLFGEHTWGIDTKIAMDRSLYGKRSYNKQDFLGKLKNGEYDKALESWQVKSGYAKTAERFVHDYEKILFKDTQTTEIKAGNVEIYNPGLFAFTGMVPVSDGLKGSLFDAETGEPAKKISCNDSEYVVLNNIPPMGLKSFKLSSAVDVPDKSSIISETDASVSMNNGRISLSVNRESGRITSLFDMENRYEWVDKRQIHGFGEYVYDVYSRDEINGYLKSYAYNLTDWFLYDNGKPDYPDIKHGTWFHDCKSVSVLKGINCSVLKTVFAVSGESIEKYGNAAEITREIIMYDDAEFVDCHFHITGKEKTPFLEAGHIAFPLNIEGFSVAVNKTGTVIDPSKDIVENANNNLFCCDKWIDVSNNNVGMLFIPRDTPLFSVSEKGIEKFSGKYGGENPDVFFNLFNNQWGTNFPQWIEGDFDFHFRIIPHKGNWRECKAWNYAAAYFKPPVIFSSDNDNTCPDSLISDESETLETIVLKKGDDGVGYILRLRDASGRKNDLKKIIFHKNVKSVNECHLPEKNNKQIPLNKEGGRKTAVIEFDSFEIRTFRIILEEKGAFNEEKN